MMIICTSNKNKKAEYMRLLAEKGITNVTFTDLDLPDIDSNDPLEIALHKATLAAFAVENGFDMQHFQKSLVVEDTSLDLYDDCNQPLLDKNFGANIRWTLENNPQLLEKYVNYNCIFRCIIAMLREDGQVEYGVGEVHGKICIPQQSGGFGFDPYIIPNSSDTHDSLATSKPNKSNARALALDNFIENKQLISKPERWCGLWQNGFVTLDGCKG